MKLNDNIKTFLLKSKMTQRDLCENVKGLSETELSRIMRGKIATIPTRIRIENFINSWGVKIESQEGKRFDKLYKRDFSGEIASARTKEEKSAKEQAHKAKSNIINLTILLCN